MNLADIIETIDKDRCMTFPLRIFYDSGILESRHDGYRIDAALVKIGIMIRADEEFAEDDFLDVWEELVSALFEQYPRISTHNLRVLVEDLSRRGLDAEHLFILHLLAALEPSSADHPEALARLYGELDEAEKAIEQMMHSRLIKRRAYFGQIAEGVFDEYPVHAGLLLDRKAQHLLAYGFPEEALVCSMSANYFHRDVVRHRHDAYRLIATTEKILDELGWEYVQIPEYETSLLD